MEERQQGHVEMEGTKEARPSRYHRADILTYRDGGGQGFPDTAGLIYQLIEMVEAYTGHAQVQARRVPSIERGK